MKHISILRYTKNILHGSTLVAISDFYRHYMPDFILNTVCCKITSSKMQQVTNEIYKVMYKMLLSINISLYKPLCQDALASPSLH